MGFLETYPSLQCNPLGIYIANEREARSERVYEHEHTA